MRTSSEIQLVPKSGRLRQSPRPPAPALTGLSKVDAAAIVVRIGTMRKLDAGRMQRRKLKGGAYIELTGGFAR